MSDAYFPTPDFVPATNLNCREHAAIHLKVPNSGTPWLDEMIRQAVRRDVAAKAMTAIMAHSAFSPEGMDLAADLSYQMADAMLREGSKS